MAVGVLSSAARTRALEDIELRLRGHIEVFRFLHGRDARPDVLGSAVRRLGERLDARFTVVEPDGRVSVDSHVAAGTLDDHGGRPEIRQRGKAQVRYSDTLRREMVYLAEELDPARQDGAVLRAAVPASRLEEERLGLLRGTLAALCALALAGAGVSYLLARWIAVPLKKIGDVAQALAGGELTRRAPSFTRDEAGTLGRALNRMADELATQIEKLRTARERLETTLSTMEDGVLSADRDGTVRLANGAATTLFGMSASPVGIKLWEAVRLPGFEEAARRVLREGVPHLETYEVGARYLSLRLAPVRAGGEGAVLVAHDVTEDRRYDELRKEFVANASHELRTPLTLVQGYVETLLDGALKDEKEAREFLGIIDRNVRRLGGIVTDLLDLSRLEAGREVLVRERVETGALLSRVKEAFEPVAAQKKQSLEVVGGGELSADPVHLERALSNLVDNALKYTPEGGRIRVSAEQVDGRLCLGVSDDGIGIPVEDQPRIFERFYRVDKSRSRDLGGTGLGLAIVKHVAQLHGGDVTVESRPGKGSTFTMRIPLS